MKIKFHKKQLSTEYKHKYQPEFQVVKTLVNYLLIITIKLNKIYKMIKNLIYKNMNNRKHAMMPISLKLNLNNKKFMRKMKMNLNPILKIFIMKTLLKNINLNFINISRE